jgi:hypothetical protein
MAVTVVITAEGTTVQGDKVTTVGTVDGVEYRAYAWKSHLDSLASKAARRRYMAGLLRDAALAAARPPTIDLSGSESI